MVAPAPNAAQKLELERVSLARLAFALLHKRFTGTLELPPQSPDDQQCTIWWRGGLPIYTNWSRPPRFGELVVELAMVDLAQLERALEFKAEHGGLLGSILVRMGLLDARRVGEVLCLQCMRKLVGMFALRQGVATVTATEHALGVNDELSSQVNVLQLIFAGVSAHYDEARVVLEMGAATREPLSTTAAFERYRSYFQFPSAYERVWPILHSPSRIEQLATIKELGPKRAAQLLFTLWACQMLQAGAQARVRAAPTSSQSSVSTVSHTSNPRSSSTTSSSAISQSEVPTNASPSDTRVAGNSTAATNDANIESDLAVMENKLQRGAHAFELFDVPLDVERKQIRHTWGELSRKFHPDAMQSLGLGHLRERVEKVFAALSEAHAVLSDSDKRKNLKALVELGGGTIKAGQSAANIVRTVLDAELVAREADKFLRAGKFDRALESYRKAAELNANEPEVQAALVWCEFQTGPKTPASAKNTLTILAGIVEDQPKCARAHYFRGLVLLAIQNDNLALGCFQAAFEADPLMIDAERQARAIKSRKAAERAKQAADKKSFGLKGLFGKK